MAYKGLFVFVSVELVDPDSLLPTHHVLVLLKGTEEVSESAGPTFDDLGVKLLEICRRGSWPEVKMIDIDHSKLIMADQLHRSFKLLVSFCVNSDLPSAKPQMMSVATVTSGTF